MAGEWGELCGRNETDVKSRGEQARDGDLLPSRWNHVGWPVSVRPAFDAATSSSRHRHENWYKLWRGGSPGYELASQCLPAGGQLKWQHLHFKPIGSTPRRPFSFATFYGRMQMSDNPLFDGQGMEFHHLQRLDQRKQSKEIQKLLKEQNKLAAEQARQRKGVCPCPHCGGGVPQVGVAVCMHCRRDLFWVAGSCGATQEDATQLANKARLAEQARARDQAESARRWEADAPRREEAKKEKEYRERMGRAGVGVGAVAWLLGILLPIAALDTGNASAGTGRPLAAVIAFVVGPALLWFGTKAGFWIANRPSPKERQAKESERRSKAAAIQNQALRDKIKADIRAHDPNDQVSCPMCKAQCRADRLLQHYDRQHGDKR